MVDEEDVSEDEGSVQSDGNSTAVEGKRKDARSRPL